MTAAQLPKRVTITEVVTRDGFQDEAQIVSTDVKRRIVEGVIDAGVTSVEVTSFVHPRVVPQMADAEDLLASIERRPGTVLSALVPNLKGAERAVAAGVDEVRLVLSASESHNRANLNRSVAESLEQLRGVCEYVGESSDAIIGAGVAVAFACPFEGRVPSERTATVVDSLVEMGATRVFLADTTGMTNPRDVFESCTETKNRHPELPLGLHLHNTRGMALANALAGMEAGVDRFDAALGGLGGCPFAPGATGNVCTEDLVHMLHEMEIETGIDLDALLEQAGQLPEVVGHEVESSLLRAGPSKRLHSFEGVRIASANA